jgi:hypothetical protein
MQAKIQRMKPVGTKFLLISGSMPIEYLRRLEIGLKEDILVLNHIPFYLSLTTKCILSLQIEKYFSDHIKSDFQYWFAFEHHNPTHSNIGIAESLGFKESMIGIKFEKLCDWFDMPELVWRGLQSKLLVLLPIYIKRHGIRLKKSRLYISYLIHEKLLSSIDQTRVIINFRDKESKYDIHEIKDSTYLGNNEMIIRNITFKENDFIDYIEIYFKNYNYEEKIYYDKITSEDIYSHNKDRNNSY